MYGMINKALRDMLCQHYGQDAWRQVAENANVSVDHFLVSESYPDKMTYDLVGAATTVLNVPASEILEAFGEYWVLETAVEGYGALMDAGGESLEQFLNNLPSFHDRITLIFPNLSPPSFRCERVSDSSMRIHHFTHRPGLAPFVRGLLQGLGKRYRTEVIVDQVGSRESGSDHDIFDIRWVAAGQ
jgi:hypothetical protein